MGLEYTAASSQLTNIDGLLADVSGNTKGTICGWVDFQNGGGNQVILSFGDENQSNDYLIIFINNNDKIILNCQTDVVGNRFNLVTDDVLPTGIHFLEGIQDGTTAKIRVDGVEVAQTFINNSNTGSWISLCPHADNCNIGALDFNSGGAVSFMNNTIWDIRYYSRALSVAEGLEIYYTRGADNIVNGLEGRWLMDEKADGGTATVASSVIDISKNAIHGTPANSPVYRAAPVRLIRSPIIHKDIIVVSGNKFWDNLYNPFNARSPIITNSVSTENKKKITITPRQYGSTIRYTLDGTTPTARDRAYSEPFWVDATTTVTAIEVKDGYVNSIPVRRTFTITTDITAPTGGLSINALLDAPSNILVTEA